MTLEEARKVARIIGTADHGCSCCVGSLVEKFEAAFPEFKLVQGDAVPEDEANNWEGYIEVSVSERSKGHDVA